MIDTTSEFGVGSLCGRLKIFARYADMHIMYLIWYWI